MACRGRVAPRSHGPPSSVVRGFCANAATGERSRLANGTGTSAFALGMTPLAPLVTARLTLRPLRQTDRAAVFRLLPCLVTTANASWRRYTPEAAGAWLRRQVRNEAEHGYSVWGAERAGDLVGLCGFFAGPQGELELGYVIHHAHQGRGFASEAAIAAVSAARGAGRRVFAAVRPDNLASIRVSEKAGLRRTDATLAGRPELVVLRAPP